MNETPLASGPPSYDERFDALATLSYQVAYRMVGSREDARDIAQEALARAYVRWPKVRDKAGGWVARVTTNLSLDLLRRRNRRAPIGPDDAGDTAGAAAERADLAAALGRLPRRQRDAVALRYLADLPEADVAAAMGCSVGTVKQHTHRGLAALRTSLDLSTAAESPNGVADGAIESAVKGAP
jgi:RNA polymerase sigma-70 factor (sigma-E family)